MKIRFLGAAQTVTGSQHFLEINGHWMLLDCGLFQGHRKDTYERNREFLYDVTKLDAVVLSHAHIDHCGNLPNLVKQGYEGPIYAQRATREITEIMLMDSGRIQEYDAAFVNKRRAKRGEPPVEPLYTEEDAKNVASHFVDGDYDRPFEPIPGVQATFVEAGHILGSTAIVLDIEEQGKKLRLWFSGDIGRLQMPLLRPPVMPEEPDYMIMECTYGDRPHRPIAEADDRLREVAMQTLGRGGKLLIPSFAVGRTQELVYTLHQMMDAREIPSVPVYVDSPLAVNVTEVFRAHPECLDKEAREMIASDVHRAALGFNRLTYVRSVDESKALNGRKDPMIIIAASGMMEAGRILHHLRNNIHDSKSTLLIVSWMAPHTLGRRLLEGEKRVKIYGEPFDVKINVEVANGYSAHGGQEFLKEYALAAKGKLRELFLVHGEARGADGLRGMLEGEGMPEIRFPERGTEVEL